jgi:hypothetical protein
VDVSRGISGERRRGTRRWAEAGPTMEAHERA